MVAKINSSRDAGTIIRYNERKVSEHKAELIHAAHFFNEPGQLSYADKLQRFRFLNEERPQVKVNMLHISLNFRPGEALPNDQLIAIANQYMEGIGFSRQPYLVYRHDDIDRAHLHIITNIIEPHGRLISTSKIGKEKSEPTRKAIEEQFGLVPAQRSPHRDIMNKEIQELWSQYRFTSLEEYNVLLRPHRLMADPGQPGSSTREHQGLLYRRLDSNGHPTGLPVKASALAFHPTLTRLEEKFTCDQTSREADRSRVIDKIDWAHRQSHSPATFADELRKEGIEVRRQPGPSRNGVVYIDHLAGVAISDRQLGPKFNYSTLTNQLNRQQSHSRSRHQDHEIDLD
jgi:Relaxase/Mobilisation nuclease domain